MILRWGDLRKCLWDYSLEIVFSNLNEDFNEKLQYLHLKTSSPSCLVETSLETSDSISVETSSVSATFSRLEKDFTSQLKSFNTLRLSSHSSSSYSESISICSIFIDYDSIMIESPCLCEEE